MQILEQQTLILHDLISYRVQLLPERLPGFIRHCIENIGSLGMRPAGRILFTDESAAEDGGEKHLEILIPVSPEPVSSAHYQKKTVFKLINAISARHEGDLSALARIEKELLAYAEKKSYQIITKPYYSIVRLDEDAPGSAIIDIYIGVNYNIL